MSDVCRSAYAAPCQSVLRSSPLRLNLCGTCSFLRNSILVPLGSVFSNQHSRASSSHDRCVSLSTVQVLMSDDKSIRVNCHYRSVHILYTRRDDWPRRPYVWHTAEYDGGVSDVRLSEILPVKKRLCLLVIPRCNHHPWGCRVRRVR